MSFALLAALTPLHTRCETAGCSLSVALVWTAFSVVSVWLAIAVTAAIAPEAAPLSITHNGLQFTSAPVPFVYEVESQEESGIIHVDARSDRRPGDL